MRPLVDHMRGSGIARRLSRDVATLFIEKSHVSYINQKDPRAH